MSADATPIQKFYEKYLWSAHKEPSSPFPPPNLEKLREPRLTVKDLGSLIDEITYKKIADWDSKGLLSHTRDKENTGWRKFSAIDVVKLIIVSELRRIGLDIDEITVVLSKIDTFTIKSPNEKIKFPHLKFFIVAALNGVATLLLIDENRNPYFLMEDTAVKFHFVKNLTTPIIILPFGTYMSALAGKDPETFFSPQTSIKPLLSSNITSKEIGIIELIRNKNYEQITLIKHDGEKIQVKVKTTDRGNFTEKDIIKALNENDFQKVTITNKNGNKVTLEHEKSILV